MGAADISGEGLMAFQLLPFVRGCQPRVLMIVSASLVKTVVAVPLGEEHSTMVAPLLICLVQGSVLWVPIYSQSWAF